MRTNRVIQPWEMSMPIKLNKAGQPYPYQYKQHELSIKVAAKKLRACSAQFHALGHGCTAIENEFEAMAKRCDELAVRAMNIADYPECSGDPKSCPENEGRGCCSRAHST